jgi:G3E family GTPase
MTSKITLDIVTGFLGSGKTTFVQAMLQELRRRSLDSCQPERVVYVVNDFGPDGVDAALLATEKVPTYELVDGCICCSLKGAFSTMLARIIAEQQPGRIVFEPSGLFILSELLSSLSGESFSGRLQIGSIVTVIDAERLNHLNSQTSIFSPLLQNQSQLSDVLVVSKLQLNPGKSLDRLIAVQQQFPDHPVLSRPAWDFMDQDWQVILDAKPRNLRQTRLRAAHQAAAHKAIWAPHHPKLEALTVHWPLNLPQFEADRRLRQMVSGAAGFVYRAKGFIQADSRTWLVQIVEQQVSWQPVRSSNENNNLTVIGVDLIHERMLEMLLFSSPRLHGSGQAILGN